MRDVFSRKKARINGLFCLQPKYKLLLVAATLDVCKGASRHGQCADDESQKNSHGNQDINANVLNHVALPSSLI